MTDTLPGHDMDRRSDWIGGASDRRVDARAARRSPLVRVLKIALPVAAVGLIGLVALWPELTRKQTVKVNFTAIEQTDDHLMMMNPKFTGTDDRNRDFFITADSASQENKGAEAINLSNMRAEMTTEAGEWYTLMSKTGIYSEKRRHLEVRNGFSIFTGDGYEVHGESGTADLKNTVIVSELPVRGQGKEGQIFANRFHTEQQGNRLFFENGVRVIVYR